MSLSKLLKSNDVKQIFADLKAKGLLIDVYSQEWFDTQPDDPMADFSRSAFSLLEEYDEDYKNHMLIVHVDPYKLDSINKLTAVLPSLKDQINSDKHLPDFLFINLKIGKILCVGLGRKNRIFCIDSEDNRGINLELLSAEDDLYIQKFVEFDHYDVVCDFLYALRDLGDAYFRQDSLPGNPDSYYEATEKGPDEEGLYYLDWDDTGYTKDELEEFEEEYESYEATIREKEKFIHNFFPDAEELNTGDY